MSLFLDPELIPPAAALRNWEADRLARVLPLLAERLLAQGDDSLLTGCHRPKTTGCFTVLPGHTFHPTPEVFIQLSGTTQFRFPAASLRLQAGHILLLPAGLPHHESIPGRKADFANIVLMLQPNRFSAHIAFANRYGSPGGVCAVHWNSPFTRHIIDYLDHLAQPALKLPAPAVAGLIRACFATIIAITTAEPHLPPRFSPRIQQCIHLIQTRLADPALCVPSLAAELNCSADHLSHTFACATGERLVQHINRQRCRIAASLLRDSSLTVAEIAHATGFRHTGYFIRVFRAYYDMAPGAYRNHVGTMPLT
jgi:AraC-like DNA-binding protein